MATGSATAGALAAPGPKATGTTVLPLGLVRTTDGAAPAPVTAMSSNGAPAAVATSATARRAPPGRPPRPTDTGWTSNGERSQLPVPTDASGVPPHGYDSPACRPKSEPQAATPSDEITACTEIAE